jgi:large subunit ribosomal protein L15e
MGAYKYLNELWRKKQTDVMHFVLRLRAWEYRQLPVIHKCTRPSRIEKARRLGYRAKQGYCVYRIRIRRGGRKRQVRKGQVIGKPKTQGVNQLKGVRNHRSIAEERVGRRIPGLRVLTSYWVAEDATFKFFEVVLVDPNHAAIRNDARINWICDPVHKNRERRGLTSAGKKHRGLKVKGDKDNKRRPSRRANYLRRNAVRLRRFR